METRTERSKEDYVNGLGFGVVQHSPRNVMVLPHHHHPSSSLVGNPMFSASNNQVYTSSLGEMFSGPSSSSSAVSVTDPFFTLSSSGYIGGSVSENVTFSEAQMHELERQRNMYNKYMMASAPLPSEILTPFSMNTSDGGSLKLGMASNAGDMEPWRCKRTDGKKWRCSRNAVLDQKYCERHAHKNRSRSRKHVESSSQNNDTTTRTTPTATKNDSDKLPTTTSYPQFYGQPVGQLYVPSPSYDHHRESRWFGYEDDAIATLKSPEIHEAVPLKGRELKRGFGYDVSFRQKKPLVDHSFGTLQGLLSPNLTSHSSQETRWFFEEGEQDKAMGSSLTLSMAGEAAREEAEGRNQQQEWISHEGPSWLCSTTLGGPLAEALCLGVSNNPSTSNTTTTSSCSRSSS